MDAAKSYFLFKKNTKFLKIRRAVNLFQLTEDNKPFTYMKEILKLLFSRNHIKNFNLSNLVSINLGFEIEIHI